MGIFDRVKEVITVDLSEKISYGNSIRKLSSEMNSNDSAIKTIIYQVGERCVEQHVQETDSEYSDLFRSILDLRERNQKLADEIQRLREQQAEEERQRQQAREEQEQLAKQQKLNEQRKDAPVEEGAKFCKNCGKPNDGDALFCVHCGTPFSMTTTESTEGKEEPDVL